MKVKVVYQERCSIDWFAKEHDLTMVVRERSDRQMLQGLSKFYAGFEHVEIKDGSVLISSCGQGNTVKEAICDYGSMIAGKLLVHRATRPERREFYCPENLSLDFKQEDA